MSTIEEITDSWINAIQQLIQRNNLHQPKIGIAMPAPFDYVNGISWMKDNNKFASLYGVNIKSLLAEKLEMSASDILFMNDAAAFLQGEMFAGAALGFTKAIGLTLGTGLGSSKCNGEIVEDANLWCTPMLNGIAEDYLSTGWFVKRFNQLTGNVAGGVKEIADTYRKDKQVHLIFDEFAKNLAFFVGEFVKAENPDVIVIGGNIMQAENLFIPLVKRQLQNMGITCSFVRAKLGENAAILGAAALVTEKNIQ